MTLLLATPVRAAELATAQVSLGYSDFRVNLARMMPDSKELVGAVTFSADVVRGRNRIVATLLQEPDFADVTHVLWCDDDQWPDDARIVPEMVKACKGILGAPYTNKREPLRWVHRADGERVLGVGFGFTMTTRECLQRVADAAETYVDMPAGRTTPNVFGQVYDTFPGAPEGVKTLLSEDYSFCVRARALGYEIELFNALIHHAGGHVWNARGMQR